MKATATVAVTATVADEWDRNPEEWLNFGL